MSDQLDKSVFAFDLTRTMKGVDLSLETLIYVKVLDLVQQSLITYLENLCCPFSIPTRLFEYCPDQFPLGFSDCFLLHLF